MTSFEPRAAGTDELLTPDNSVLVIIDYQPVQVQSINSMDKFTMINKVTAVAKLAKYFKVPTILSTVNVASGRNQDTISELKEVLGDLPSYDRSSINAWEDREFNAAVKATGRKKIIICALWTEACLTFPTLDAIGEGFEVYPVVDAVGGTSVVAHETALRRVEQAGAQLVSYAQLACEFQRDWNRGATVPGFVQQLTDQGIFLKL